MAKSVEEEAEKPPTAVESAEVEFELAAALEGVVLPAQDFHKRVSFIANAQDNVNHPAMAAGYPPNLDDGKLWPPLEIIPDLGSCGGRQHHCHLPPFDLAYFEDLAQKLAAFGFVDGHPRPSPYPLTLAAAPPVDRLAVWRDLAARLMCHRPRQQPEPTFLACVVSAGRVWFLFSS